jgi:2-polyprenyl-3-methyl-5-hydroxy-6-metoxy-1,4-benzoquinol methylase
MMLYGSEKAVAETDWKRRLGYRLVGEMHIPGRLRIWHVMKELRRLGYWKDRPLRVLDAGGGEGAFAYHLARRFPSWTVVVADNEPATLERGRRIKNALGLRNLEVRPTDLLAYDEDGVYDLIICSDVLEHIWEDDKVVRNLARALKSGGAMVLTSPSVPQPKHLPFVAWREKKIGFTPADYGHVRQGYSDADFRRILTQAGMVVDVVRFTYGRFGTLMFDVFFVTGDSRPNPAIFAALFPFYLGLSALDLAFPGRHGAGILGVGRKP